MAIQISYIFALLPLYILLYLPLSNLLFPRPILTTSTFTLNTTFIATEDTDVFNPAASCPPHSYELHILSQEPLMIYIENFLSKEEQEHLVKVSQGKFAPSTISKGEDTAIDASIRLSEVALLERDETVRCIEYRARAFQGWRSDLHIERLRTQRYGKGGHYAHHFDWSGASRTEDRVSTFMVYVQAKDLVGGGTEFPRLQGRQDGRWCEFLNCGESSKEDGKDGKRLSFKALAGNAVFWVNVGQDGRGIRETYHAGEPVLEGEKIGLNIWSWGAARQR